MNPSYLSLVFSAVLNTPIWVWLVFVYLIMCGIKAMRSRNTHIFKLILEPAIFLMLGYVTTFGNLNLFNMLFLVVGLFVGVLTAHQSRFNILKNDNRISLEGEYLTLTLLLGLFVVKYIFGYTYAVTRETADKYSYLDTSISILISCLFVGRASYYLYRFFRHRDRKETTSNARA